MSRSKTSRSLKRKKPARIQLAKKQLVNESDRRNDNDRRKNSSQAGRRSDSFELSQLKDSLRKKGLNPSLPFGILNTQGDLVWVNARLEYLMGIPKTLLFPSKRRDWQQYWGFFNEEKSSEALLDQVVDTLSSKKTFVSVSEFKLKTYKLFVKSLGEFVAKKDLDSLPFLKEQKVSACALVFVELLRPGDLLSDTLTRQALFRSVAHEIRTSVMALAGMIQMAMESKNPSDHLERMRNSVLRLEKVVERLGDLRARLGLTPIELKKNAEELAKLKEESDKILKKD